MVAPPMPHRQQSCRPAGCGAAGASIACPQTSSTALYNMLCHAQHLARATGRVWRQARVSLLTVVLVQAFAVCRALLNGEKRIIQGSGSGNLSVSYRKL